MSSNIFKVWKFIVSGETEDGDSGYLCDEDLSVWTDRGRVGDSLSPISGYPSHYPLLCPYLSPTTPLRSRRIMLHYVLKWYWERKEKVRNNISELGWTKHFVWECSCNISVLALILLAQNKLHSYKMVSLYVVKVYGWKLGLLVDGVVVCSCDCYHSVYGAAPWWWSLTRTPAGQVQRRALLS